MRKIVSQVAGAVAVVTAATFAFAQTNEGENRSAQPRTSQLDKANPTDADLKSSETGSRFGPGANNGSTYNPAIRSTDIKAGNVSSIPDPAPVTATTAAPATAPAPVVTAAEPAPVVEPAPAVVAAPEPTPAPATMMTDDSNNWRPARADRN